MTEKTNWDQDSIHFQVYKAKMIEEYQEHKDDRGLYDNQNKINECLMRLGGRLKVAFDTNISDDCIELTPENFLKSVRIIIENKKYNYLRLYLGEEQEFLFIYTGEVFVAKLDRSQSLKEFVRRFADWLYWQNNFMEIFNILKINKKT